ncbi:transposase [Nitrospira sp. Ecomares 2.1]
MKRSEFSEEPVISALAQEEEDTSVGNICRQPSVAKTTFSGWKKKYAYLE